jgi:hypothetical protein
VSSRINSQLIFSLIDAGVLLIDFYASRKDQCKVCSMISLFSVDPSFFVIDMSRKRWDSTRIEWRWIWGWHIIVRCLVQLSMRTVQSDIFAPHHNDESSGYSHWLIIKKRTTTWTREEKLIRLRFCAMYTRTLSWLAFSSILRESARARERERSI